MRSFIIKYIHTYILVYTYVHAYIHTCIQTYIQAYIHTYIIHTYIRTHIYIQGIHTHAHMHTYTGIHVRHLEYHYNTPCFADIPQQMSLKPSGHAQCGYLQYRGRPGDNFDIKFTAFCEGDNYYHYACPGMYIPLVLHAYDISRSV